MSSASPTRRHHRLPAALGVLALFAVGTACEPVPPPSPAPVFEVQTTTDLRDADPGDGVCEATPGQGDCTLRAGIEEGNALGSADLEISEATHDIDAPLEVTGAIRLVGSGYGSEIGEFIIGDDHLLHVTPGASLVAEDLHLNMLPVRVEGSFVLLRSETDALGTFSASSDLPTVTVEAGGAALVQNAWVANLGGDAIQNRGWLMIDLSTIGGFYEFPRIDDPHAGFELGGITTSEGGRTYVRGTWVAGRACHGTPPVSMGYNAQVSEASCGLTDPTDQQRAPRLRNDVPELEYPTGTLVDAIPLGEGPCGDVPTDITGTLRPADGDADGTAACDIGALER